MPIYKTVIKAEDGEKTRLIEAKNGAKALAYATSQHITIEKATNQDLIDGTKAGLEVEKATDG